MPRVALDIHNSADMVRQISLEIAYEVVQMIGLENNARFMLPGSNKEEDLPITVAGDDRYPRPRLHDPNSRVIVTIEEEWVDDRIGTTILKANENRPIFSHADTKTILSPVYAQSQMTLSFRLEFPDRNQAERAMKDFRFYASTYNHGLVHDIKYRYAIPEVATLVLSDVYRCLNERTPMSKPVYAWMVEHFDNQVIRISNQNAKHMMFAKEERQLNIHGNYEFTVTPNKPESNESNTKHTMNFEYTVRYDKPLKLMLEYPILVANVPLNPKFYDQTTGYDLADILNRPSQTIDQFNHFNPSFAKTEPSNGLSIPPFDNWRPTYRQPTLYPLVNILTMIDEEDPRLLCNLLDTGYIEWREHIETYMTTHWAYLNKIHQTMVLVQVYVDDAIKDDTHIEIDEELNVTLTEDPDRYKTYRVTVSLYTDLIQQTPDAIERLRQLGEYGQTILWTLCPELSLLGMMPKLDSRGHMHRVMLQKAIAFIHDKTVRVKSNAPNNQLMLNQFMVAVE